MKSRACGAKGPYPGEEAQLFAYCLLVEDVEAIYRQAVAAGATTVFEPERTEWGSIRARVLDIEGYEWSFGTYEPGAEW